MKCKHCKLKVNSPYDLHHHIANGECKSLRCSSCDDHFFKMSDLTRHLEEEHDSDRKPDDKSFRCPICSKRFSTKRSLSDHKKTHLSKDSQKYVCRICDSEFVQKRYLHDHLRRSNKKHFNIINAGLSKFSFVELPVKALKQQCKFFCSPKLF